MATVTVQPKGKCWYSVISYKDETGKWRNKMQTTGLTIKGNKKRAEKIASKRLAEFHEPKPIDTENPLLTDYLKSWLPFIEYRVERSTFVGYESTVNSILIPYFAPKYIHLKDLTLKDIQLFYDDMQRSTRGKKGNPPRATTIRRYHAVLHKALEHAIKLDLIPYNPADRVDLPKKEQVIHNTFTEEQLRNLNELLGEEEIGPLIQFTSVYGTRRSESCGMRWCAVDFEQNLLTINHTVVSVKGKNGKKELVKKDRTKNSSSYRTFPLTPEIRALFLALKKIQDDNRKLFGRGYNEEDSDYIFVDTLGNLINPDYLTSAYKRLLDKYDLPKVTLHEIRHTVATLLLKHRVPMKYLQSYLGHSDFSTTANFYAHVCSDDVKEELSDIMTNIIAGETK
ncbi:MAG: site-specific integrase [Lachnospiraceae bacterium]|nr:site-specific integrase [Lachnospiraceae bacterium]